MNVAVLALMLFALGLYGVLTRRDLVAVLASIEVMMGGALLLLAGLGSTRAGAAGVEAITLLMLVLAAAGAALGLALLVAVARRTRTTRAEELTEVKG